jgi:hypothetical protein
MKRSKCPVGLKYFLYTKKIEREDKPFATASQNSVS